MISTAPPRGELARIVLSVLALGLLMTATVWILSPFILALVWATMIAVATWPMLLGVQRRLRNSRALAVLVMSLGTAIYWRETRALARRGGDLKAITATLPAE